jgi:hypothetical protein
LFDPEIYRYGIELAGCEKILFGTDFPLIKPQRYFDEIEKAGLIESQRKKICGINAATLLNIKTS